MEASKDTLFTAGSFTSHLMKLVKVGDGEAEENKTLLQHSTHSEVTVSPSEVTKLLGEAKEVMELKRREQEERDVTTETWGALCVACVLVVARKQRKLHPQSHRSQKMKRKWPVCGAGNCQYDVFLGGSCNPTSWRKDIVIPYLQREGITFYNPQVDHWSPELIDVEEEAKQAASTLLYVVDNQTRAVSSMIEVANFIGSHRNVLIVVNDIIGETPTIGRDVLSRREVEDLNRGRSFVRLVSENSGSLLESNVQRAVTSLVDLSRMGQCACEEEEDDDCCSRPSTTEEQMSTKQLLSSRLRLLRHVHTIYDTGRRGHLTANEARRALQALDCHNNTTLSTLSSWTNWPVSLPWKPDRISFAMFLVLYAESMHRRLIRPGAEGDEGDLSGDIFTKTSSYLKKSLMRMTGWLWSAPPSPPPSSSPPPPPPPPSSSPSSPPPRPLDVYLGGSCGNTSWRQDDVIPILDQYGVTYFNPQVSDWDTSLISIEQAAQDKCSVLLYIISGDTLGVGSLVEVAYCIGQQRKKMVLVLSDIPSPPSPDSVTQLEDNLKLSERGVRDYNRGRAYLASMARKREIPLFTDLVDATLCAVYLAKGYEIPVPHASLPLRGTSV